MTQRLFILIVAYLLITAPVPAQVRVLLYHAHENLGYEEEMFRAHMDFLVDNGYTSITPEQFLRWRLYAEPLPPRPIMITIDDNYIKTYTEMWPILRERGLVGVNFAISGAVGAIGGLHYCSWEEILEMEESGAMITESHTVNHPFLTQLSTKDAQRQLTDSLRAFRENIPGKGPDVLAYPYGDHDDRIMGLTRTAGYAAAFSTIDEPNTRTTDLYALRRSSADGISVAALQQVVGYPQLAPNPPGPGWAVNDNDANCFVEESAWNSATAASAFGGTYRWRGGGSGIHTARWGLALPEDGWYEVRTRWVSGADRTDEAVYTVFHADGAAQTSVDQRTGGGEWHSLGRYRFAGAPAEVILTDDAPGRVVADAVWFEPVPAPGDGFLVY